MDGWTYGAEHEWADWPLSRALPAGYGRDMRDKTIVNSSGIANDPKGRLYGYGGEINTPPTESPIGQVMCLQDLRALLPEAKINYRSNLHIHVRVPGLGTNLEALRQVQRYIHANMREVLEQIEPLPKPLLGEVRGEGVESYLHQDEYLGACRRWRRRRVSHQTLLTTKRLGHQLGATTVDEFYRREVPQSRDGRPLWHCQARVCVNLRQHRETDTIEFRHFPGTMSNEEMGVCVSWCRDFLRFALGGWPIEGLLCRDSYSTERFPHFPRYNHWMERRYRATVHDGTVSKSDITRNIRLIELGEFK